MLPEAYAKAPGACPGFILAEIMVFLEASAGPQDAQSILDFLRENLGIEWKTFAQLNYRLNWLRALGKVSKAPEGWSAA